MKAIITTVGLRPIACFVPIYTFLKDFQIDDYSEYKIILLYTEKTESKKNLLKEVLSQEFKKISFTETAIQDFNLTKNYDEIYFNFNGGLNFQISSLTLKLPDTIKLMCSDSDHLYIREVNQDIKNAETKVLRDIGLENYCKLTNIQVNKISSREYSFSDIVENAIGEHACGWEIILDSKTIPDEINKRIIWVTEKSGMLNILFDLFVDDNKTILNYYREICDIFNKLNYSVCILTNNSSIFERMKKDAINGYITIDSNKIKGIYKEWQKGNIITNMFRKGLAPKPKYINWASSDDLENKKCLFTSIGDNPEPTLKAILSVIKDFENFIFFVDKSTWRVLNIANNFNEFFKNKEELKDKRAFFIPTDHMGENILNFFNSIKLHPESLFNITPGTKSQSVSLTQLAKLKGLSHRVVSIAGNEIKTLLDNKKLYDVVVPSFFDLVNVNIAFFDEENFTRVREISSDLWIKVIELFDRYGNSSFKNRSRSFFNIIFGLIDPNYKIFDNKIELNGKTYEINDMIFTKEIGFWWECAVADAISRINIEEIIISPKWVWGREVKNSFMTEIDIVFRYKGYFFAVSCKTATKYAPPSKELFNIRTEAVKRLGRFTYTILAYCWNNIKDQVLGQAYKGGNIYDGTLILTPKILKDKNTLKDTLDKFIKALRTTEE